MKELEITFASNNCASIKVDKRHMPVMGLQVLRTIFNIQEGVTREKRQTTDLCDYSFVESASSKGLENMKVFILR